jgi:hypothetical protein
MAARERAFNAHSLAALVVQIVQCRNKPIPSHFSRPFATMVDSMLREAHQVKETTA